MNWFPGSYSLGCQVSKKNKALLIVFIDDGTERSRKMEEFWGSIGTPAFPGPYVAIHLKTAEPKFKEFKYPTLSLPATFFIDDNSTVLKIVDLESTDSAEKLSEAIRDVIKILNEKHKPSGSETPADPTVRQPTLEDKVKHAKVLLEKKKKDDDEKKKLEEKEKELERIRSGKLMQEAAERRREQEMIEAAAARRREKLASETEKERLRAQIKADREEREYRLTLGATGQPIEAKSQETRASPTVRVESNQCRVQIRLPDNSTFIEEFPSAEKLSKLVARIQESGQVHGSFNVVQTFPRHIFTADEFEKSFLELCLTPSCTLIIEQKKASKALSTNTNFINYLFTLLILSPLSYAYNFILGFFGRGNSASEETKKKEASAKPRAGPSGDASIRRRGNVSGLHNPNGNDSEDNANWNGNSTQFM